MSSPSPSHTTQTTEVKLPAWVEKASEDNYKFAQHVANRPYQEYQGPRVANQSNMTTDAYNLLKKNIGAQDPLYKDAYNLQARAATENDPIYARAQGILADTAKPWDPTPYLNPYITNVEDRVISNANRQLTGQLQTVDDKAKAANAFGSSKAGVERAVLGAEGTRHIGDLSAELRKAGFDKATADLVADRTGRQNAAAGMMTGAGAQNKGWLDAAQGILGTAEGRQGSVMKDFTALMGAGADEQKYNQSKIEADREKWQDKWDYPTQQLNTLLASLGMSPYGKTEHTEKEGTSEQGGTDWASTGLGVLSILASLSDRRDKTDIKDLGEENEYGLPLYAYRYKGDPKTYPKVVGPMAQDAEKKYPKLVKEIGGHKVVATGLLSNGV